MLPIMIFYNQLNLTKILSTLFTKDYFLLDIYYYMDLEEGLNIILEQIQNIRAIKNKVLSKKFLNSSLSDFDLFIENAPTLDEVENLKNP